MDDLKIVLASSFGVIVLIIVGGLLLLIGLYSFLDYLNKIYS